MTSKRRRWRLVIPVLPVLALIGFSLVAHAVEEPDPSDPAYLSPTVAGPDSAGALADRLRARGVTVKTATGSDAALDLAEAARGGATLFIPSPQYPYALQLTRLALLPDGTRVVLVEPDAAEVAQAVDSIAPSRRRWATWTADPGPDCALTEAGRAGVVRTRYGRLDDAEAAVDTCYGGGLARVYEYGVEFVLVGSDEPFRAERFGEHANADLAVDLLGARRTLVWLDLHEREKTPPRPRVSRPPVQQVEEEEEQAQGPSPFPEWLFWVVVTLLAATLTIVLARGRRLGAPVPEALPVEVPGAETAAGRGRLYRRAKARGPALETLRTAARRRLAVALGLPGATGPETLLPAVQARTGDQPQRLHHILYGPEPETDEELHLRAVELRLLVEQVTARPAYEGEHR